MLPIIDWHPASHSGNQLFSPQSPLPYLKQWRRKRLTRTVLIFTESSDQLSRATDRVPGLPASPG
ncbi:hypothetical protein MTQ49_25445, partial [Escherichia coli]|nr:hypothetical protein [Escherichia coli]